MNYSHISRYARYTLGTAIVLAAVLFFSPVSQAEATVDHEGYNNEGAEETTTASIEFYSYLCQPGVTVSAENGPDNDGNYIVPSLCAPQEGIIFGYIHEDIDNRYTTPYAGMETPVPFTIIGQTDSNGFVLFDNVQPGDGRYDVAKVNSNGMWATSEGVLKLFCNEDSTNPDNYEMVFTLAGETHYCVLYHGTPSNNSGTSTGTTTPGDDNGNGGTGGDTDEGATSTPPINGGGGTTSTSGGSTGGSSGTTGSVLGASTKNYCNLVLGGYIKFGGPYTFEDVIKLQVFLNTFEHAGLTYTGIYDAATHAAVHTLQVKYSAQILKPWYDIGLLPTPTTSTGYVYKTTSRYINNTVCPSLNLPMPQLP